MEYYGDRYYKGLDLDALGVDEFYLNLYSPNGEPFTLYSSHKECSEVSWAIINTTFSIHVRVSSAPTSEATTAIHHTRVSSKKRIETSGSLSRQMNIYTKIASTIAI